MNRRNFLKSCGLTAVAIGAGIFYDYSNKYGNVGLNIPNPSYPLDVGTYNELEDLYSFIESKTISNIRVDNNHLIPFKLYPYQKQILKDIHENDKLIIVKCRQLGMTTLLAGYAAWINERNPNTYNTYYSHKTYDGEYNKHYDGILEMMNSNVRSKNMILYPKAAMTNLKNNDDTYYLSYADEANFDTETYHGIYGFLEWKSIMKEWQDGGEAYKPHKGKIIIAGSVDGYGLLERATKDKDFKVVTYPIDKCKDMFNHRPLYTMINSIGDEYYQREFECKFV